MVQKNAKKKVDKKASSKETPAKAAAVKAKHIAPQPARAFRAPVSRINRRFPESSSASRQLQLLLAGSMPLLRQKVRGAAYQVRSFFSTLALKIKTRQAGNDHRFVQTAVFLAASLLLTIFAANRVLYTTATTLFFEGKELGTVASEAEAQAAVENVESSISRMLGSRYSLSPESLSYTTGVAYRGALVEEADLEEALSQSLRVVEHGYALYIDDEFIGATQTEGALDELMAQVATPYRNENTVSIDFVEKWEIRECDLPLEDFTNLADVALLLNSVKAGEQTYTVEAGDCWSVIAEDHNMENDDLLRMNPGYDIDKLQIGDVLVTSQQVPYLTVRATQMEYYVADIPYEIEYVDDNTMWEGDTRIITKGAYGTADTVARVTYEGVNEVERVIESQTTITEPVTEVQARGTLERPSWAPTGSFRWPTSGSITSKYGYRNIFGGSSFHGGIDIANSYGTDIVAADGGVVCYAGWMSGYGYLVQIDHQNGYVTYYGHNSSLLVSVGDKVFKGQHIAEMGSTGRSTGNHCHFEVRVNGERTNPMNLLP
ncbi:MAG: peptidoglycan DD-metalloendopeptidase family protein [Oscillospiraceae bacterium]|nr:peptidoglycan DD-metalloendopeptidase family protein [Oscillospiraceae bacterium]